uniref:hypothetical protein n=1 Tax=Burkholderia cepacia TaxID=292 RepID=UPI002ABD406E
GVYKAAGKAAANVAAKALLDERQRELVLRNTQALRNFAPELKRQVSSLGDEKVANSIGYLLASLVTALARWRARGAAGQSANVKPKTTSKGEKTGSEGMIEAHARQHPTTNDPNPLKDGCA